MVAVAALIPQLPTITVVTPAELRQVLRHADHVDIIMGMHINKARRQYPPLAINHLLRRNVQRRGDSHNSIALHRHISTVLRPAAPVDHRDVLKSQSTFIAITPFRHADKLTIYKRKNSGKLRKNQIVL